jgi:hypothetical protein
MRQRDSVLFSALAVVLVGIALIGMSFILRKSAAAAAVPMPAALPDIPECGTSSNPDLVIGYIVCSINYLHAENTALKGRLSDVETIKRPGLYADALWQYMGDRGEFDERRRLTFQDPRRQLQTRHQIELSLCRWGVPTSPRLGCPPAAPDLSTP